MSLTDDLANLRQKMEIEMPADLAELGSRALRDVIGAASGGWLEVGDRAPDFSLPNAQGKMVGLEELRRDGPVVISFYRGTWCPFCRMELLALQQNLYEISRLRSSLVAISPQKTERAQVGLEQGSITFELLHDAGNRVAREFGVVFDMPGSYRELLWGTRVDLAGENGGELSDLPVPATYVVDPSGLIHYAFADPDFTRRADPIDIIRVLRGLSEAMEAARGKG